MRILITMFLALLLTAQVGCGVLSKRYPKIEPPALDIAQKSYRIGVGDSLNLSVWRNPDLSVGVVVRPDGKISAPLVGDIKAEGLTADQLSKSLTKQLANFVRTPQVTVIVNSSISSEYLNRVRVTGAVAAPQSLPFRKGMTVMDLVLTAGGVNQFANENSSKLYRKTKHGVIAYPVYLKDILERGDLRTNYILGPSDILTVPETIL